MLILVYSVEQAFHYGWFYPLLLGFITSLQLQVTLLSFRAFLNIKNLEHNPPSGKIKYSFEFVKQDVFLRNLPITLIFLFVLLLNPNFLTLGFVCGSILLLLGFILMKNKISAVGLK